MREEREENQENTSRSASPICPSYCLDWGSMRSSWSKCFGGGLPLRANSSDKQFQSWLGTREMRVKCGQSYISKIISSHSVPPVIANSRVLPAEQTPCFPGRIHSNNRDSSSEFAWLQELEDASADITREMKALARAGGGRSYKGGTGEMSTVYDATQGWGTMRMRYMGRCVCWYTASGDLKLFGGVHLLASI